MAIAETHRRRSRGAPLRRLHARQHDLIQLDEASAHSARFVEHLAPGAHAVTLAMSLGGVKMLAKMP